MFRGKAGFDKFTKRARTVLSQAEGEAHHLRHDYIGPEHILIALAAEGQGVAAKVLRSFDVGVERLRAEVQAQVRPGGTERGQIGPTAAGKKVIEAAVQEAGHLHHSYIGTEHLLLGLMRDGQGVAAGVLRTLGLDLADLRSRTVDVLSTLEGTPDVRTPKANVVMCRLDDADLDALDTLIEAGVRTTRSDAAAWLIHAGVRANTPLFESVRDKVAEIRRLRESARVLAEGVVPKD